MGLVVLAAMLASLPLTLCLNNTLAQTPTVSARYFRSDTRWLQYDACDTLQVLLQERPKQCVIRAFPASPPRFPLQMGFNTWNAFGPDIDEQLILQTAGFMNNLTLSKLGYNLIVLDGASPALSN